jgi:hypothetical protein
MSAYVLSTVHTGKLTAHIWERMKLGCDTWYCLTSLGLRSHVRNVGGMYSAHDGCVEADQECYERQAAEQSEELWSTEVLLRWHNFAITFHAG